MDQLDANLTKAYFEAADLEPELVDRETPKLAYLRADEFDPKAAAQRLAYHWKFRKLLFKERWLLPMDQTGRGALSGSDCEILRKGYLIGKTFPNYGAVIMQDLSRVTVWNESFERCMFYWQYHFGSEVSQTMGVSFLHVVSSAPSPIISIQNKNWEIIQKGMPMKTKGLWVAQTYEEGKQELIDFKVFQTMKLLQFFTGRNVIRVAEGSSAANLRALEDAGIRRSAIPPCLGGSYDYREFDDFIRRRISVEDIMASSPPSLSLLLSQSQKEVDKSAAMVTYKPRRRKVVEVSERSAVYSRRYNHRKRVKEMSLKDEHKLLVDRNNLLLAENERLRRLLEQALLYLSFFQG